MKQLLCILLFFFSFTNLSGQGLNNIWLSGYQSQAGHPDFGVTKIDFNSGIPVVNSNLIEMEFRQTHANISDGNGNLLFYTNGYYIANANNDTMINGTGINPSDFTSLFPDGLTLVQSHLIIPIPNDTDKYYLFHTTRDDLAFSVSKFLYASIIDMSLNGGVR